MWVVLGICTFSVLIGGGFNISLVMRILCRCLMIPGAGVVMYWTSKQMLRWWCVKGQNAFPGYWVVTWKHHSSATIIYHRSIVYFIFTQYETFLQTLHNSHTIWNHHLNLILYYCISRYDICLNKIYSITTVCWYFTEKHTCMLTTFCA